MTNETQNSVYFKIRHRGLKIPTPVKNEKPKNFSRIFKQRDEEEGEEEPKKIILPPL